MTATKVTLIRPNKGFGVSDLVEIWEYRELLWALVVRDIKVRYKQTLIGGLWAIIQPFTTMIIFSFFFGVIAHISSGGVPYPVFSYAGLVLWVYFTGAITAGSSSMIASSSLITKVYFPRIIIPIAATITGLVDYLIAITIVFFMMLYYHLIPSFGLFFLPFVVFMTWILAMGISFWLSAINVKYRDVQYAVPFFIQLLLFVTPVIYPLSIAPNLQFILSLNPMTGLIEAHRSLILGNLSLNLASITISVIITILIIISGAHYFKSNEKSFADII